MVKFGRPTLLVGGFNEFELLDFCDNLSLVDVLVYYNYQEKHFNLIKDYFPRELWEECPVGDTLKETTELIKNEPYTDYFEFMLMKFIQKNEYNAEFFSAFLNSPYSPRFIKDSEILRHYNLKKYYQSMIIDMELGDGNKWNRFYDLPPNFFSYEILEDVLDHLLEGGVVKFINGSLWDILDLVDGFEEVEEYVYRKMKTEKKKYKKPRWYL